MITRSLADLVLLVHVSFVVFVIATVPMILLGAVKDWAWVRVRWFRAAHFVGVCVVAAQSWLGLVCPLTTLEMWLRERAGQASYAGNFVEYWLHRLVYWDLPPWVFVVAYTLFALLVLATWVLVPPRRS